MPRTLLRFRGTFFQVSKQLYQFDFSRPCPVKFASFVCFTFIFAFEAVASRFAFVVRLWRSFSASCLYIFRALTALCVVRIMISGMAIWSLLYRRTTVYNFCLHVCVGSKTDADCGTFGRYHDRFRRGTFIRGKSTIFVIFLNGIT